MKTKLEASIEMLQRNCETLTSDVTHIRAIESGEIVVTPDSTKESHSGDSGSLRKRSKQLKAWLVQLTEFSVKLSGLQSMMEHTMLSDR